VSLTLQPFSRSRQTPCLASAPLPRRVRETLQDVLALVIDYILGPLERALEDLELELHRAAQETDDFTRRTQRLAHLRALQRGRDRVAPCFIDLFEAELAALRTPPVPASAAPPAEAPSSFGVELRLLEDDEAQDDALLRAITMRYEARAGLALQLLGQRFGVLGARAAFDAEQLPVGPHRLTMLVADACASLELHADVRRRLMEMFEHRALAHYEELADAMNETLVRRGVLPSMTFVPIRMRPRARDAAGEALPATKPAADAPAVPFDLLRSLLAQRRAAVDRFRTPQAPRAPEGAHAWRSAALPGFGDVDAPTPTATDAAAEDVRELVGLWYARIMREVRTDSPSAPWLEALRPAVVQAALADPHVFDRPDHPVRQLLDAIVDVGEPGTGDDDLDPVLHNALARAVDQVVADGGEPRAFQAANDAVQDTRRAVARRADVAERRLVEAARGRERLTEARARAADALARLTGERTLPHLARTLVHQAWVDVLTLTALRNGAHGGEWLRQIETTRQILDVVTGAPAPADLATRIRDALTAIGTHEDEARMIAAYLGASDAIDDDTAATRTELVMRLKARARLGAEALPDVHEYTPPLTPDERARLATLPVGDADAWFDFDAGHEAASPPRRRLVWAGAATNTALFVNRRGQRAVEIGLDALARELDAGRVRPVTPDPRGGVTRAWNAMLAALRGFDSDRGAHHG
jgi:hypothetical protein